MTNTEDDVYGFCMPSFDDEFDEEFDDDEDSNEEDGMILACEDCDYRWKIGGEDDEDFNDYDSGSNICPMCGSSNVLEI